MKSKLLPEHRITLLRRLVNDLDYKILYWDIETSPCKAYVWGTGETYIRYTQLEEGSETKIITIQWMFEGDAKPQYLVWDKVKDGFDDSRIVETFITDVLRKYPQNKLIVIGQNHKAFDHMVLNERAKVLRLTPPTHNMIKIDTYQASKQSFKTASHSLDARSKQYKLGGKIHTDLSVWTEIMEGKADPEDRMIPYGLKDVTDLRTIFWQDLPYVVSLPAELETMLLKAAVRCERCEANKKPKYNIEKVKGKNKYICHNCEEEFVE